MTGGPLEANFAAEKWCSMMAFALHQDDAARGVKRKLPSYLIRHITHISISFTCASSRERARGHNFTKDRPITFFSQHPPQKIRSAGDIVLLHAADGFIYFSISPDLLHFGWLRGVSLRHIHQSILPSPPLTKALVLSARNVSQPSRSLLMAYWFLTYCFFYYLYIAFHPQ